MNGLWHGKVRLQVYISVSKFVAISLSELDWRCEVMPFGMINISFCYATAGSICVCVHAGVYVFRCVFVCVSATLQV